MRTIIYYFTGTGNSLAVSKKIAAVLGDTEPVPIASLAETPGEIVCAADRIGIVFPVYFTGLPAMAAAFAARLRFPDAAYIFGIATFGGSGAVPALRQLDGILRQHAPRGLDAGFRVKMPGNYILMYEPPTGVKRERMLAAADAEIARIAEEIRQCRKRELPRSIFGQIIHGLMYSRFIAGIHDRDRRFTVSDACTSCGTCVAICPARNIDLVDEKPVWQHRCELCCACIHACPVQAIQAGRNTAGRHRYRNPAVTVAELERKDNR